MFLKSPVALISGYLHREATTLLLDYLDPDNQLDFQPSCPIFGVNGPRRILELGSGQAVASLRLAKSLSPGDLIVLTDLPEVIPLCKKSIEESNVTCQVVAQPLGWGQGIATVQEYGPFTHILMCDLVSSLQLAKVPSIDSLTLSRSTFHTFTLHCS